MEIQTIASESFEANLMHVFLAVSKFVVLFSVFHISDHAIKPCRDKSQIVCINNA